MLRDCKWLLRLSPRASEDTGRKQDSVATFQHEEMAVKRKSGGLTQRAARRRMCSLPGKSRPLAHRSRPRSTARLCILLALTGLLPQVAAAKNGDVLKISRVLESVDPSDLAFAGTGDEVGGSLWASTLLSGRLYRLNLALDEILTTIDNPHRPEPFPIVVRSWGIAYRPSSGTLFVLAERKPEWRVKEVKPDGTEIVESAFVIQPPDPATSRLRGLTFDPESGELWYLDTSNDLCVRSDLSGQATVMLNLPGDDPPRTVIRGEGLGYFEGIAPEMSDPTLYVAYGDIFKHAPSRLLQLTLDGVETGVDLPLTGMPGESFYGFEIYRMGPQIHVAQTTTAGTIIKLEHTLPDPVPPSRLSCRLTSSNHVDLSWVNHGEREDNAYAGEIVVLRNGSPVTTVPGTATAFVDSSPSEGNSSYALQATAEPGGALSPPSFPCDVTVGTGGLIRWVNFAGKAPYDLCRDPRQGDIYATDPVEGTIYRYNADLQVIGEVPSPMARPGAIAFIPTIDIQTLTQPGEEPSFTTFENILAVGREDSSLVSFITLEGEARTTLSFELSGGTLGGLTYITASEEFVGVELRERQLFVLNQNGRLKDACFPRNILPPALLSEEERLNFGITYDVLEGTLLSSHDDGVVRELFAEVDAQGGCVVTAFDFSLQSLGEDHANGDVFGGIQIADNTLLVCGTVSNAIFQVLVHPFTTRFRRGDTDRDKAITLTDAVQIAAYLFRPSATALTCLDAADTNDDGILDVSDPVYLLFYLFRQGPAPPAPFDQEGSDPTFRDNLGCEE